MVNASQYKKNSMAILDRQNSIFTKLWMELLKCRHTTSDISQFPSVHSRQQNE